MRFGVKKTALSYRALLTITCVVAFGGYVGAYIRMPILPLFARSLGADTVVIGAINSSFMLLAGLLCLPMGMMSDRFGRKRLIAGGLLVSAVTSLLLASCETPWQIMAVYLFAGAGLAAFAPTAMSFVSDISPVTHLGRSYGWYTMAMYGGMSIGPALGGFVANLLNFRWVFAASGIFIFLVFLVVLIFLPKRTAERRESTTTQRNKVAILRELLRNRALIACWLVTLSACFGLGVFITFVPLHASDQGISIGKIGLIFGMQAIVNALGRIPFGYLSDRVPDRGILVLAGLLGYSASIAGTGLSTSLPMFLASSFAMGLSMGVAFTAVGALVAEVVSADSRGLAMGGYNTCIYMGMMLSTLAMGFVARSMGFRACFIITAVVNAAGAFAFVILFRAFAVRKRALSGT